MNPAATVIDTTITIIIVVVIILLSKLANLQTSHLPKSKLRIIIIIITANNTPPCARKLMVSTRLGFLPLPLRSLQILLTSSLDLPLRRLSANSVLSLRAVVGSLFSKSIPA